VTDLIFLHGVGLDRKIWQPLQSALPDVKTHAPDLRGHGDGPNWKGPATLDGFVSDLWDYADGQGLESFALCGFSLGAMIAQWAALTKPARISHLVLLNGAYARRPEQMAGVQARFKEAELHGPKVMIDAALARWFPAEFAANHPEYLAQIRARLMNNDTEQFLRSYKLFAYDGARIDGRLKEIRIPALVATGGLDTGSTPEMARMMASEFPNAQCAVYDDAAHMLPMQKPSELAGLVMNLLEEESK
jgi:pimeloyl-ACP methyl ester carboxylesterase